MESVRVDKWLWSVRHYKNRSEATKACGRNEVQVEGHIAKASRMIQVGMRISVKLKDLDRVFEVTKLAVKPVGNKNGHLYYNDVSSPEVKEILEKEEARKEFYKEHSVQIKKSVKPKVQKQKQKYLKDKKGRPTKKERRNRDNVFEY